MIKRNFYLFLLTFIIILFFSYSCLKNSSKTSSVIERQGSVCTYVYPSKSTKGYCSIMCNSCPTEGDVDNFNMGKTDKIKNKLCPLKEEYLTYIEGILDDDILLYYNTDDDLDIKEVKHTLEYYIQSGILSIDSSSIKKGAEAVATCQSSGTSGTIAVATEETETTPDTSNYRILMCDSNVSGIVYFKNSTPTLIWKTINIESDLSFKELQEKIPSTWRFPTKTECEDTAGVRSLELLDKHCSHSDSSCSFPYTTYEFFWTSTPYDDHRHYTCKSNGSSSVSRITDIKLNYLVVVKNYSEGLCNNQQLVPLNISSTR